jgi:hypothetical protein
LTCVEKMESISKLVKASIPLGFKSFVGGKRRGLLYTKLAWEKP